MFSQFVDTEIALKKGADDICTGAIQEIQKIDPPTTEEAFQKTVRPIFIKLINEAKQIALELYQEQFQARVVGLLKAGKKDTSPKETTAFLYLMRELLLKKFINAYERALYYVEMTTSFATLLHQYRKEDFEKLSLSKEQIAARRQALQSAIDVFFEPYKILFIHHLFERIRGTTWTVLGTKHLPDGVESIQSTINAHSTLGTHRAFENIKNELIKRKNSLGVARNGVTANFYQEEFKAMQQLDTRIRQTYQIFLTRYQTTAMSNKERIDAYVISRVNFPDSIFREDAAFLKFAGEKFRAAFEYESESKNPQDQETSGLTINHSTFS